MIIFAVILLIMINTAKNIDTTEVNCSPTISQ